MDFGDSVAYVAYHFYSKLAIHNAPLKILDSFIPLLCVKPTYKLKIDFWIAVWFKNYTVSPDEDEQLHHR